MLKIGNKKEKTKGRWNYCHHMPILTLLGDNHHLPSLHTAKRFICLEEAK